jgi:hypothetical protein
MGKGLIKIIDLEINHVAICFKRPKVVFPIRVVGVAEILVDRDGLDDPGDCLRPEGGDATRHHGMTVGQVAAQLIIERANAFGGGKELGPQRTARAVVTAVRC